MRCSQHFLALLDRLPDKSLQTKNMHLPTGRAAMIGGIFGIDRHTTIKLVKLPDYFQEGHDDAERSPSATAAGRKPSPDEAKGQANLLPSSKADGTVAVGCTDRVRRRRDHLPSFFRPNLSAATRRIGPTKNAVPIKNSPTATAKKASPPARVA